MATLSISSAQGVAANTPTFGRSGLVHVADSSYSTLDHVKCVARCISVCKCRRKFTIPAGLPRSSSPLSLRRSFCHSWANRSSSSSSWWSPHRETTSVKGVDRTSDGRRNRVQLGARSSGCVTRGTVTRGTSKQEAAMARASRTQIEMKQADDDHDGVEDRFDEEFLMTSQKEKEKDEGFTESSKKVSMTWQEWKYVILPFLFPALGGLLFGYDIGATSDAILSLKSASLSGVTWYDLDPLQTGLVVSGSLGGALLGSALAFKISDSIGRRKELLMAASLYILGSLLMGAAPSLSVLVAGRLVYGFGIGLAMHAAPMYIAETAPAGVRGMLISLKEGFIVGGILAGYFVGNATIEALGGWRLMYGAAAPVALAMAIGTSFLPRSPRWLLLRAVNDQSHFDSLKSEARAALSSLRGSESSHKIDEEMAEMLASLHSPQVEEEDEEDDDDDGGKSKHSKKLLEEEEDSSWHHLLRGTNGKALVIGTGLVFFQQITGQPSVLYYAATVLKSAGLEVASDATKAATLIGAFKLLMTGIAIVTVDKVGRRPLLLGGVTGIVLSLFLLSSFVDGDSPTLSVLALLLYVGSYQISFGPISWLLVSEIFPLRVRGRALGIATLVNFGANAAVTFGLPPVEHLLGEGNTFLGFGFIGILALAFIAWKVPETMGLSLEEIELKLRES